MPSQWMPEATLATPEDIEQAYQQRKIRQQMDMQAGLVGDYSFGETHASLSRAFSSGGMAGAGDVISLAERAVGDNADTINRQTGQAAAAAAQANEGGPLPGYVTDVVQSGARSFTSAAPAGVVAGPVGAITAGGLTAANQSYTSAIDAGLSDWDAAGYAVQQGGIEGGLAGVFQKFGFPGFEGIFGREAKNAIAKGFKDSVLNTARAVGEEALQEGVTSWAQNVSTAMSGVDPNANDLERQLYDIAVGAGAGGATTAASRGAMFRGYQQPDEPAASIPQTGSQDSTTTSPQPSPEATEPPVTPLVEEPATEPIIAPEAVSEPPVAPQGKLAGFTTAKGSTYVVDEQGRTKRDKAARKGHEDSGPKELSAQTVYIAPENAAEVGAWQTSSAEGKRVRVEGDEVTLLSKNPQTGEYGIDARFPKVDSPAVDMSPLELWDRNPKGWFRGNHPGSPITEIQYETPEQAESTSAPATTPPAPTIDPIATIKADWGYDLKPYEGNLNKDEQAAADFLKSKGIDARFVEATEGFKGGAVGNSVVIGRAQGKSLWRAVGHELAHASGIDLQPILDAPEVQRFMQERASRGSEQYRNAMQANPELGQREAVASFVGELFEDGKFRQQIGAENPGLVARVLNAVKSALGGFSVPPAQRRVMEAMEKVAAKAAVEKSPTVTAEPAPAQAVVQPEAKAAPVSPAVAESTAFVDIPKARSKGSPIDRKALLKVFPGGKISRAPNGWYVSIGDSYLTVEFTNKIEMTEEAKQRFRPEDRDKVQLAASYSLSLPDGTRHAGLGLIRLVEGLADSATLRHEALHLAKGINLIGQAEWNALVQTHAPGITDPYLQEEAIATARESEADLVGVWDRVKSFVRRFLSSIGITDWQARDVHMALDSIGAWRQAKTPPLPAEARYQAVYVPVVSQPGFQEWFGESKVLDEEGKPRVVYHGTAAGGWNVFDTYGTNYGLMGAGGYFTENPEIASKYTKKGKGRIERRGSEASESVYPVYLAINNPLDMDAPADPGWVDAASYILEEGYDDSVELMQAAKTNEDALRVLEDAYRAQDFYDYDAAEATSNIVQAMGYDGLTHMGGGRVGDGPRHRVWIAYHPEQIKSATANIGTYDSANPDIRYQATYGRPDLANPATNPDARTFVDDTDEKLKTESPRGYQDAADVARQVAERLAANYSAEVENLRVKGRAGLQLDRVETAIGKAIMDREGTEAFRSKSVSVIADAIALQDSYRRTGTAQSEAFRERQDPVESPDQRARRLIVESILEPPAKLKKTREAALERGDNATANKINADWAQKVKELQERLLELGIDLDNLWPNGYSKKRAKKIEEAVVPVKATVGDMIQELYRFSLLSAITTQDVNILGMTLFGGAWNYGVLRPAEAMTNLFVRDKNSATFGEFSHLYAGMLPGMAQGWRNFWTTLATESPQFAESIGRETVSALDRKHADKAIKGLKGRIVRLPTTMLSAFDDFFSTTFGIAESGARAYRIALSEGLTGDALSKRMNELIADVDSKAWDQAYEESLRLTFKQSGGTVAKSVKDAVNTARRGFWPAYFVVPFLDTPVNVAETGLRMSPAGSVAMVNKMYRNYKEGKSISDGIPQRIVEQGIAWAVVAAMFMMDDEEPWITGTEVAGGQKQREVGYRTPPAMSVKFNGQWYSYSRLDPFAIGIATAVDFRNAAMKSLRDGNPVHMPIDAFRSVYSQSKEKTFLTGVADMMIAVEGVFEDDPLQGFGRWGSNFVSSWVPNIVRSPAREADEYYMNRRVWGATGEDWWKMLGQRTLQKAEIPIGVDDFPSYDVWGRPGKRSDWPMSDWIGRIIMPVRVQEDQTFVADRVLMNWNLQNPTDQQRYPIVPPTSYTDRGEKITLSEGQYADFTRLAGEAARLSLENMPLDPENPTIEQINLIRDFVSDTRGETLDQLKLTWGEGAPLPDPSAIAKKVRDQFVARRLFDITSTKPGRTPRDSDNSYMEKVLDWKEAKESSESVIKEMGLSTDEQRKILSTYLRSTRGFSPTGESYLGRMRRIRQQ